jgi:hypothetical protein
LRYPTAASAGLLRTRRERPRSGAAEQRDELAPSHSISSSASNGIELGSSKAKCPGCLQVDDKLEFGGLRDRQVGGLHAPEDLTGVDADLTIRQYAAPPASQDRP